MCVLLVEDEVLIRSIMADSLREAGFDVVDVGTAQGALAAAADQTHDFTVLITDFHLAGTLNGLEVARLVRDLHPALPVIVATGRPDVLGSASQTAERYLVLAKPYGARKLIETIRAATHAAT